MAETLNIIIKADDQASGPLRGLGGALGSVASVAGGILGAQVFTRVADGIMSIGREALSSIPAASNLNEAINASSVVFGDAAGVVQDFGRTAADSAGLSESAFNQLAATTGAMLQNYGLDADEAASSTVDLAQRAADMASIFNTDVSDAMDAINAGLRGESNPLERYGVSMNAATVEAQALALGFEKVNGRFEDAALTQARMSLLMEQTNSIAGDFANTSDELANATRVNEARWENFMSKLGQVGLPIMTAFQSVLMDIGDKLFPMVESAMANVAPVVEAIAGGIGDFVTAITNGATPLQALWMGLSTAFGTDTAGRVLGVVNSIKDFGEQVAEFLAPAIAFVQENVKLQDVLAAVGVVVAGIVIPALASVIAAAAPAIATFAAIVAAVALLRKAWESDFLGIKTALTDFWQNTAQPALSQLAAWLGENVPRAIAAVSEWFNGTFLPAVNAVWSFIDTNLIPLFAALGTLLGTTVKLAVDVLAGVWQNVLQPALLAVWNVIKTQLQPVFEMIANFISAHVAPKFNEMSASIGGVSGAIQSVIGWIQRMVERLNNVTLPEWLQRHSPSPFEMTFLGASEAIKELSNTRLPRLRASLSHTVAPLAAATASPMTASGAAMSGGNTYVVNNTFTGPLLTTADERQLEVMLYSTVERIIRQVEDGS